jgi:hypothetical protein
MATAKKKPVANKPCRPAAKAQSAVKPGKSKTAKPVETEPEESAPKLTELEAAFVEQYLIDKNGTRSYLRVKPNAKETTARTEASKLLAKPNVRAALDQAKIEQSQRIGMTADDVVRQTMAIVQADVRELVEIRVSCCRYCWGEGYRYQRTAAEFERAEEMVTRLNEELVAAGKPGVKTFDPQGGIGYDKRRDPNKDCPECFGEGESRVVIKDTAKLSPAAARLLAGIKQSKEGIEIKTHSVDSAMKDLFRHFGLYNDKVELTMPTAVVKDMTGRKG